jgi:hypothetical protein
MTEEFAKLVFKAASAAGLEPWVDGQGDIRTKDGKLYNPLINHAQTFELIVRLDLRIGTKYGRTTYARAGGWRNDDENPGRGEPVSFEIDEDFGQGRNQATALAVVKAAAVIWDSCGVVGL